MSGCEPDDDDDNEPDGDGPGFDRPVITFGGASETGPGEAPSPADVVGRVSPPPSLVSGAAVAWEPVVAPAVDVEP
jgi:hypothetical protein